MRVWLLSFVLLLGACRAQAVAEAEPGADAGETADAAVEAADACTPNTCGADDCGELPDGCGGTRSCRCASGALCIRHRCVAAPPLRCSDVPWACGAVPDGNGGTLDCACAAGRCVDGTCCIPKTCADVGNACGLLDDRCGGSIDCGCARPTTCFKGACCAPKTCADAGNACGAVDDGCGGTITCGCATSTTCFKGACCSPKTCADVGNACGALDDGCGGLVTCGCASTATCLNGSCCTPKTCAQLGKNCGVVSDGCGGTVECGYCSGNEFCGAGGVDHVCSVPKPACSADGWCVDRDLPFEFMRGLVGSPSRDDVWLRIPNTSLLFNVGASGWRIQSPPAAFTAPPSVVSSSAPGNTWALTDDNKLWHLVNGLWTAVAAPPNATLERLSTAGASGLWVHCTDTTYRRDGGTWTDLGFRARAFSGPEGGPFGALKLFRYPAPAALVFYDAAGTQLSIPATLGSPYSVDVVSVSDIWAGTHLGLEHFDGARWSLVSGEGGEVLAFEPNELLLLNLGLLYRWNRSTGARQHVGSLWAQAPIAGTTDFVATIGPVQENLAFLERGAWRPVRPESSLSSTALSMSRLARLDDGTVLVSPLMLDTVVGAYANGALEPWRGPSVEVLPWSSPRLLCGRSRQDFWAVGPDVTHVSGSSLANYGNLGGVLLQIACAGTQAWRFDTNLPALEHWDGSAWAAASPPERVRDVDGLPSGDAWALGETMLMHWDGSSWSSVPLPSILGKVVIVSHVAALSATSAFAWSSDSAWLWDGAAWTQPPGFTGAGSNVLSAASPTDAFTYGARSGRPPALAHFDGQSWSTMSLPPGMDPAQVSTLVAAGNGDALLLGAGASSGPWPWGATGLVRWDAAARDWKVLQVGPQWTAAVGGSGANDVWAVGMGGLLSHRTGGAWTDLNAVTLARLSAVSSTGTSAWAVGDGGACVRAQNGVARLMDCGTTSNLVAVFAVADDDVWIGGEAGTLRHWNGTAVSQVALTSEDIVGLWAAGSSDVWAAGTGSLFHFDGTRWTTAASAWSPNTFTALSGFGGSVFLTSAVGQLYRFAPPSPFSSVTLPFAGPGTGVAARSASDLYVSGRDALLRGSGSTWTRQGDVFIGSAGCKSVYVADAKNAWAVCPSVGVVHQQLP